MRNHLNSVTSTPVNRSAKNNEIQTELAEKLIRARKSGDKQEIAEVENEIILSILYPYIGSIITKHYNAIIQSRTFEFADLLNEAALACMEKMSKYDPTKGIAVTTYMTPTIKNSINLFTMFDANSTKYYTQTMRMIEKYVEVCERDKRYSPSMEEICHGLSISEKTYKRVMEYKDKIKNTTSLCNMEGQVLDIEDHGCNVEKEAITKFELTRVLTRLKQQVPSANFEIFMRHEYYGLSFTKIAKIAGLSPQDVRSKYLSTKRAASAIAGVRSNPRTKVLTFSARVDDALHTMNEMSEIDFLD